MNIPNNPLIISLCIYIALCLIIYYTKPNILFDDKDNDSNDNNKNNNRKLNNTIYFFKRNKNVIFILAPFFIYGLVCIFISNRSRKQYCKMLKQKEITIKDLLKKCKG